MRTPTLPALQRQLCSRRKRKPYRRGFQGIIDGVNATKAANGEYHPIGTNVEDVLVGQRTAIREEVSEFDVGSLVKKQ